MHAFIALALILAAPLVAADDPLLLLEELSLQPHVELVESAPARRVREHLVPLGAMSKIRGVWSPRESQRHSGDLSRFTWRVFDGVSSKEVLAELAARLVADAAAQPLFACEARACGSSAQWANRIFGQRVIYGTEKSQEYRVYLVDEGNVTYRVLLYASARTTDRQYLHAELLRIVTP